MVEKEQKTWGNSLCGVWRGSSGLSGGPEAKWLFISKARPSLDPKCEL